MSDIPSVKTNRWLMLAASDQPKAPAPTAPQMNKPSSGKSAKNISNALESIAGPRANQIRPGLSSRNPNRTPAGMKMLNKAAALQSNPSNPVRSARGNRTISRQRPQQARLRTAAAAPPQHQALQHQASVPPPIQRANNPVTPTTYPNLNQINQQKQFIPEPEPEPSFWLPCF